MSDIVCNTEKGSSLIETLVAMLLLSVGLIAILSMQPTSYKTSARADYLGRGIMILNKELMTQETWIMNPCNTVTVGNTTQTVNSSYQSTAQNGDASFNVATNIIALAGSTNSWLIRVTVTWPPTNTKGITDSMVVTRQESFRFGCI